MSKGFVSLRADMIAERPEGLEAQQKVEINGVTGGQLSIMLYNILREIFTRYPAVRRNVMLRLMEDDLDRILGKMDVETED